MTSSKGSGPVASNEEVIALFASMNNKPDLIKLAALLQLPKTTIEGRWHHNWRKAAMKLTADAIADGRLKSDGSVNVDSIPAAKKTARTKAAAGTPGLHGVKTGRVTKGKGKGIGNGKKANVVDDEPEEDEMDEAVGGAVVKTESEA